MPASVLKMNTDIPKRTPISIHRYNSRCRKLKERKRNYRLAKAIKNLKKINGTYIYIYI